MRTFIITILMFTAVLYADVFTSSTMHSYALGKRFGFEVTGERVLKTPIWKADADSPPLAPRRADQLATAKFRKLISDTKGWKRGSITLVDAGDSLHWYYVIHFVQMDEFSGVPPTLHVIVLMDGTVVEPRIDEDKRLR
ncbi:MAG: hypothetical protein WCO56_02355 [Verrucomicrobiota bacterium]